LEQQLLGSLFLDPHQLAQVAGTLERDDFVLVAHRMIYQACLTVAARTEGGLLDLALVGSLLKAQEDLESVGGMAYLVNLTNGVPVALFAPEYAARLHELGTKRRLLAGYEMLARSVTSEEATTKSLLEQTERLLVELEGTRGGEEHETLAYAPTLVNNYLSWLEAQQERTTAGRGLTGVPTGLPRLDQHTGGWQPGNLIVLAASTGHGKSASATCFAYHALRAGHRVAYFSLEMTHNEMMGRFFPMETGITNDRLRMGDLDEKDWQALIRGAPVLAGFKLAIDEATDLTPASLRLKCKTARERLGGLDLIIVDYYQLMSLGEEGTKVTRGNQVAELEEIAKKLKKTARAFGVPVLVLAQLSSGINLRTNSEPTVSDIRGCKSLVNDADLVFLLNRPEKHDPETDRKGQADLILAKGRNVDAGRWTLYFNGPLLYFTEIASRGDFEPISSASGWAEEPPVALAG
jgi:replicative DNA helicase